MDMSWRSWAIMGGMAIAAVAGLLVLLRFQPDLPGRWCEVGTEYSVCARSWLAALSGWAAAAGAGALVFIGRQQVAQARAIADEQQRLDRRAMVMTLASSLENLSRSCGAIVSEIENWNKSEQMGKQHSSLPVPAFAYDTSGLTGLPDMEAQNLLRFGREIVLVNETAPALWEVTGDEHEVSKYLRVEAAKTALTALVWHDRIAPRIGWEPMPFDPDGKEQLELIVADR